MHYYVCNIFFRDVNSLTFKHVIITHKADNHRGFDLHYTHMRGGFGGYNFGLKFKYNFLIIKLKNKQLRLFYINF